MKGVIRFLLVALLSIIAVVLFAYHISSAGAASPPPAIVPVVWLIPGDTTFTSFSDLFDNYGGLRREAVIPTFQDQDIDRVDYEIRDPIHHLRLVTIPCTEGLPYSELPGPHLSTSPNSSPYFSVDDRQRRLARIGPGSYQLALLVNGIRASNVVPFRIDPDYDYKSQPSVRLAKIEAPPGCPSGALVAWIIGPPIGAKEMEDSDVLSASINCDGTFFGSPLIAFTGNRAFNPGERIGLRLEVDRYGSTSFSPDTPHLPLVGLHNYVLQVRSSPSAPISCNLSTAPLGEAWDRETSTLCDAPPTSPVLSGYVRDGHGNPLSKVEVLVYNEKASYLDHVNSEGHYAFASLPVGTYSIDAYRLDLPPQPLKPYFPPIVIEQYGTVSRDYILPDHSGK